MLTGILAGLKESTGLTLEELQPENPGPGLICSNFDGASVKFGIKYGVVTHTKSIILSSLSIVCIAMESAALDASKSNPYMGKFEDALKSVFTWFHYSSKRLRELKNIVAVIDKKFSHLEALKSMRWMSSKLSFVSALKDDLQVVVMQMENEPNTCKDIDGAKVKGYMVTLKSAKFIKMLYGLCDYLPTLSHISKAFQQEDILLIEVPERIHADILRLQALKVHPGPCMQDFLK